MSHISPTEDERICAWFECQSEETLRDLEERFDAVSPRECWHAFFNDCSPPAHQGHSKSLAAPAAAGQGVGIRIKVRRSVGLLPEYFSELSAIASDEGRSIESVMRSFIVLGLLNRRQERLA